MISEPAHPSFPEPPPPQRPMASPMTPHHPRHHGHHKSAANSAPVIKKELPDENNPLKKRRGSPTGDARCRILRILAEKFRVKIFNSGANPTTSEFTATTTAF
jgi:hypothetical protein